jgi:SpoVK/Ycf46/Vps4 family AAA+-type ATPase
VVEFPDEEILRETIAQDPNNVTARYRLAELLLDNGRGGEALEEAQAALALMPDHPGLLGIAVMSAELGGRTDLAGRYARVMAVVTDESLRSNPSLASAAAGVRWGRRRTDHVGDSSVDGVDGVEQRSESLEIDLTALHREESDHTEKMRESRWPLPRRLRPGKGVAPVTHPITVTSPRTSFADVAGMTDLKWRLQGIFGPAMGGLAVHTGGAMLFGPPGCGKTHLTEAIAGQIGARMVRLNLHDVVSAGEDQGAEMIRSAFALARQATPSVVILEDVDALSDPHKLHARRIDLLAMRLSMKLDEVLGVTGLTVLATSSFPWRVDAGLRAAGRLERGLFVAPPDLLARGRIIVDRLSFLPISPDVNPGELAVETEGLTARELISICASAAEHALCVTRNSGSMWSVQQRDLRRALDRVEPSSSDWFVQAHSLLRNGSAEVDPVYDYIRRHVRKF